MYVRDLTMSESKRLSRGLKEVRTATYLRRMRVVAFSGQGMRAKEIAERLCLHEEYVREPIRRFNAGSFNALRPRKPTGRPRELTPEEVSVIVEVASTPFWSRVEAQRKTCSSPSYLSTPPRRPSLSVRLRCARRQALDAAIQTETII